MVPWPRWSGPQWWWKKIPQWICCALTSCCYLKTPLRQNPCHCHLNCLLIHCHETRCRVILSHCHSSRRHPSLRLRVMAGVASSCHHLGSWARHGAHGCCRFPQSPTPTLVPVRPHLVLHNHHCNCWPCGEVGWWNHRESPRLCPSGSWPVLGSTGARPGLNKGNALIHCSHTWDGPKVAITTYARKCTGR